MWWNDKIMVNALLTLLMLLVVFGIMLMFFMRMMLKKMDDRIRHLERESHVVNRTNELLMESHSDFQGK